MYGLKHQKEKRSLDHFAGLDVSVKETSLCIVDDTGRIVREVRVASEPEALLAVLTNPACHFKRIGLEAGPLSQSATGRTKRTVPSEYPAKSIHPSPRRVLPLRRPSLRSLSLLPCLA